MSEKEANEYKAAIVASGLDIYAPIDVGNPELWIPTPQLQELLSSGLVGLSLAGLPLRTRSKIVKQAVCQALGYPVPKSFAKVQPRFTGQNLDIYTQKSLNLQIWNEELSATRRYALIRIDSHDVVRNVLVVIGQSIAMFDTTGTITTKYQARLERGTETYELISAEDTPGLRPYVADVQKFGREVSPVDDPQAGLMLPIDTLFHRLKPLIGATFDDPGRDQDRNRGAALHRLVCKHLGYDSYEDMGQFPDIRHQLLEIKLQTSPTVDLGLVLPSSTEELDVARVGKLQPRHCDTRYALFYATAVDGKIALTHLFVSTGADFFSRFRRFEGKVRNGKIQIPLPRRLFGE